MRPSGLLVGTGAGWSHQRYGGQRLLSELHDSAQPPQALRLSQRAAQPEATACTTACRHGPSPKPYWTLSTAWTNSSLATTVCARSSLHIVTPGPVGAGDRVHDELRNLGQGVVQRRGPSRPPGQPRRALGQVVVHPAAPRSGDRCPAGTQTETGDLAGGRCRELRRFVASSAAGAGCRPGSLCTGNDWRTVRSLGISRPGVGTAAHCCGPERSLSAGYTGNRRPVEAFMLCTCGPRQPCGRRCRSVCCPVTPCDLAGQIRRRRRRLLLQSAHVAPGRRSASATGTPELPGQLAVRTSPAVPVSARSHPGAFTTKPAPSHPITKDIS